MSDTYSHHDIPKSQYNKDESDTRSHLSYVSEIMNKKKKKIFGIIESTINFAVNPSGKDTEQTALLSRSLSLAPSTFMNRFGKSEQPSPFIGRESDNYKDNTKEKILQLVNNNKYLLLLSIINHV